MTRTGLPWRHIGLSEIPVASSQGQTAAASVGLDQQTLIQVQLARLKVVRRTRQIQAPDSVFQFPDQTASLDLTGFQPPQPMTQGQEIMLAQVFEVADFE